MKRTLSLLVVAAITTSSVAFGAYSVSTSYKGIPSGLSVSGEWGQLDNSSNTASEERSISLGYKTGDLALSASATTRDGNLQDSQSISGRYDHDSGFSALLVYDTDLAGDAGAATGVSLTYNTRVTPGITASVTTGYTNTECGDTSNMFGDNSFTYGGAHFTASTRLSSWAYAGVQCGGYSTTLSSTENQAYGAASLSFTPTPGLTFTASGQTRDVTGGYVKSDAATGAISVSYNF